MARTLRVIPSAFGPWMVGYQHSAAVRYSYLKINGRTRQITLKVPKGTSIQDVDTALALRDGWIDRFIAQLEVRKQKPLQIGETIPFKGQTVWITHDPGVSAVDHDGETLRVGGGADQWRSYLEKYLRHQARVSLMEAVQTYADELGVAPKKIAIRDTKSRWGSCSTSGTLSFSWRSIMAPPPVLHYLAAHEVSHMRHMDHSPAFWDRVAECMVDWPLWRDWLHLHGSELMKVRLA